MPSDDDVDQPTEFIHHTGRPHAVWSTPGPPTDHVDAPGASRRQWDDMCTSFDAVVGQYICAVGGSRAGMASFCQQWFKPRFKPSCQKQVFAGFYQTWYNNCSIKIMLTVQIPVLPCLLFTMTFDLNYACIVCARLKRNSGSNLICIRNHIHQSIVEIHQEMMMMMISTESKNMTLR